jgi:flagellar assembly protein FliH
MSTRLITGDGVAGVEPFDWAARRRGSHTAATPLFVQAPSASPAPADLDARLEEARQRGIAAGREAMARESRAAAEADRAAMTRAIESLGSYKSRLRHESERDLVELALAIARRILRRELSVDPHAVAGLARAALDRLDLRDVQRVRLHPSHAQPVAKLIGGGGAVDVVGDPSLELGSALFETARGTFDAGVETQLIEIERGLADLLA